METPQFEKLQQLQNEYGDVFQYRTFAGRVYVLIHPKLVRMFFRRPEIRRTPLLSVALGESVLASDGEHWQSQRRSMLPSFREPRIAESVDLMVHAAREQAMEWKDKAATGQSVDIVDCMSRLTLSVVSRVLFTRDLIRESEEFLQAYAVVIQYIGDIGNATAFNSSMSFAPGRNSEIRQALETMNEVVYGIIGARREERQRPDDLLSMLLEATTADGQSKLTNKQVRDEVVTMLLAGHETTALSMTWVWYLLARNPQAQCRLQSEIDSVLAGRAVRYADFASIPYSRMVIDETLRLYPAVSLVFRQVGSDIEFEGYSFDQGCGIAVSPYLTHRHPGFWPDPERFDPERFDNARTQKREAFTYIPFGAGRHTCLGKHFALLEMQAVLITVLQMYQVHLEDPGEAVPKLLPTLRPVGGLKGRLEAHSSDGIAS